MRLSGISSGWIEDLLIGVDNAGMYYSRAGARGIALDQMKENNGPKQRQAL